MRIKSQAKRLREGPVFRLNQFPRVRPSGEPYPTDVKTKFWYLSGRGNGIGKDWVRIGEFEQRKYALMLMKAITLKAREKKP